MITIKKDIPIVKEFLGTTDNICEFVSPFKTIRQYYKESLYPEDFIIVLTPMMAKESDVVKKLETLFSAKKGKDFKAVEHKRGKNFVYTFE